MKLNNRGYMLVEIILASAIAFGMAFFLTNMTIKLKNKNDDMLIETIVSTDQAIISNAIMRELKGQGCDTIKEPGNELIKLVNVDGSNSKKVYVNDKLVTITSEYATVYDMDCIKDPNTDVTMVRVSVPIRVKQLPDRNFDVELYWTIDD